jgi:hypothetical protein
LLVLPLLAHLLPSERLLLEPLLEPLPLPLLVLALLALVRL